MKVVLERSIWITDFYVFLRFAGYLCRTESQYAAAITEVVSMDQTDRLRIAGRAREQAGRFSDANFMAGFLDALRPVVRR